MATATKSKTKLVPLGDRLVIKAVVQEEVLASGIVIPDTAKEKPQQGEGIAAGRIGATCWWCAPCGQTGR